MPGLELQETVLRYCRGDMPVQRSKARVKLPASAYPKRAATSDIFSWCRISSRALRRRTSSNRWEKLVPSSAKCRCSVLALQPSASAARSRLGRPLANCFMITRRIRSTSRDSVDCFLGNTCLQSQSGCYQHLNCIQQDFTNRDVLSCPSTTNILKSAEDFQIQEI